jgi:hypothetical protein
VIATRSSRPHYAAHLAPILERLPPDLPDDVCLVASHRDLVAARREGFRHLILAQHGIGQSYTKPLPSYPGGKDNHDVGLFLVPNQHAADRWREAYPGAPCVEVVGSPIIDTLPRMDPRRRHNADPYDTVAVSFHWDAAHTPEAGSAFRVFRDQVAQLAERFHVIGHGHPLRKGMQAFYERNGIEYVPDFADVCRRADVYVCDNSSTLYEFAATGRPVVVLNSPQYRGTVNHGLRFWDAAHVGLNAWHGDDLGDVVERALQDPPKAREDREDALDIVYAYRSGGAQRAADAIVRWLS